MMGMGWFGGWMGVFWMVLWVVIIVAVIYAIIALVRGLTAPQNPQSACQASSLEGVEGRKRREG